MKQAILTLTQEMKEAMTASGQEVKEVCHGIKNAVQSLEEKFDIFMKVCESNFLNPQKNSI